MQQLLLSICLPTYNQPREFERTLKSVLPQVTPEVEIVIRDDSLNLETEKIVGKYSARYPIRYFRRGKNVFDEMDKKATVGRRKGEKGGLDRAIIFLTQEAAGEYIWWLGDDVLVDGAVRKVLETIKRYPETSFIWVNYIPFGSKKPGLVLSGDQFFRDGGQVLEKAVGGLGFISATLFKKEKAISGIKGSEKYIGSAFVNLYLILHVLSQGGRFYYLETPYIINYPNPQEKMNPDGFEVFGVNLFNIVNEFKNNLERKSVRKMLARNFSFVWRGVLVRWITGYESPKGKRWPMMKLYWSYPGFWAALPFLLMPLFVNKFLYRFYKLFFRERKFRFKSRNSS